MKEYNHETEFTHDIIIIGGGTAGLTLAEGASRLGLKTILLEKERTGGSCLFNGCIPAKNLIRLSSMYSSAFNSENYGISLLKTPEPDYRAVMDQINDVIEKNRLFDSEERLKDLGAEVMFCSPEFLNSRQIGTGRGQILSAAKIVIATGSSPFIPDIEGLENTEYLTNKDIFSLKKLPGEMIVLGGGYEGIILSQAMARLGVMVTVILEDNQILSSQDKDISDILESALEAEGVKFIKESTVTRVEQKGKIKTAYYKATGNSEQGSGITQIMADSILVAAGRKGNTDSLKLKKAGIFTENTFIPVDERLRTVRKNICAIGDVNGSSCFTHTAGAEASYILRTLEMKKTGKFSRHDVPWCIYTDPGIASIGLNVNEAEKEGIDFQIAFSEYPELENRGRIKILIDSRNRIIGTQIAGSHADELLIPAVIAFNKKLKLMDILSPAYPYPSLGSLYKNAADSIFNEKTYSLHSKKLLRFMYRYRGRLV